MTNTEAARPAYRVLGTTDEITECEHCGRRELKGTIRLAVLDADGNAEDVVHFGATCGARAAGWTVKDIRKSATAANRAAAEAARVERDRLTRIMLDAADAARFTADCPTMPTICRMEGRRNGRHCPAHSD